jgi:PTH2 family peptidyl-tRNA hydrolase
MLKQIFLINTDLKMDKGKIAVQVSHGTIMYIEAATCRCADSFMEERYHDWRAETKEDPIGMMKKAVLKSTESEIRDMYVKLKQLNIWCYLIYDLGLTQVIPNSLTCLVVEPLEEDVCNNLFGDLKLY